MPEIKLLADRCAGCGRPLVDGWTCLVTPDGKYRHANCEHFARVVDQDAEPEADAKPFPHGHDLMSPEILRLNYEMLAPADARQAVHDALRLYKGTCWCGLTPYKDESAPHPV